MIDFILGLYFASLAVRGWIRGFVREVMDLLGLVIGILAGIRFSEAAGRFIESWSGIGPGTARVVGGIVIMIGVGLALALVANWLGKVMRLPGLNLTNRLGGGALAFGWGWMLATILISVASVVPLPDEWQAQFDESTLVSILIDEEQPAQQAIRGVTGDRTLQAALNFEQLLGGERVVLDPEASYAIDPVDSEEVERDRAAEQELFELVNRARLEAGLDVLDWHERLSDVAEEYARRMATEGFFSHVAPDGSTLGSRVAEGGVPYRIVGENLALAVTVPIAHDGLMESPGHRANILHEEFSSVGIGIVETPYGLIAVQVFHG